MSILKTHIDLPESILKEITYTWCIFCQYAGYQPVFTEHPSEADVSIGLYSNHHIRISDQFIKPYSENRFHHSLYFKDAPLIKHENGSPDYISTCYYMINCIQEYAETEKDELGRFTYENSYQSKFNCFEKNLVTTYFEKIAAELGLSVQKRWPKKVFLSHDMDSINRGNLTEAKNKLKSGDIPQTVKNLLNYLSGEHHWLNIDELIQLHRSHKLSSAFFWMTEKGENKGISNADYSFNNKKVKKAFEEIEKTEGFFNGLHKSSFPISYKEELKKLPSPVSINRNHFLMFSLPGHFEELSKANLQYDSSLGFSRQTGFRNNYGLPFHPFNITEKCIYPVMEIPLNMMDTYYLFHPDKLENAAENIINLLRENEGKSLITLLWHNNYLTKGVFSPFREQYTIILEYLEKEGYSACTKNDLETIYNSDFPDILKDQRFL